MHTGKDDCTPMFQGYSKDERDIQHLLSSFLLKNLMIPHASADWMEPSDFAIKVMKKMHVVDSSTGHAQRLGQKTMNRRGSSPCFLVLGKCPALRANNALQPITHVLQHIASHMFHMLAKVCHCVYRYMYNNVIGYFNGYSIHQRHTNKKISYTWLQYIHHWLRTVAIKRYATITTFTKRYARESIPQSRWRSVCAWQPDAGRLSSTNCGSLWFLRKNVLSTLHSDPIPIHILTAHNHGNVPALLRRCYHSSPPYYIQWVENTKAKTYPSTSSQVTQFLFVCVCMTNTINECMCTYIYI